MTISKTVEYLLVDKKLKRVFANLVGWKNSIRFHRSRSLAGHTLSHSPCTRHYDHRSIRSEFASGLKGAETPSLLLRPRFRWFWSFTLVIKHSKGIITTTPLPGPQTKCHLEKGGKLNTSQAGSVAARRAAVGQFLSISREAFILRTRFTEIG